jgi:uncharacterized protein (TIGR01627 family)
MRDLPKSVVDQRWDIVFVDSPQGGHGQRPGRMQSLYTASVLARKSAPAQFLAHDCDRTVEAKFCDRYLSKSEFVAQVRTLRHYQVRAEQR